MFENLIKILNGTEIGELLLGREEELIEVVSQAYIAHQNGHSSLPHSVFLRFPEVDKARIIGLPAFLGSSYNRAGIKWISSFPGNVQKGIDRASAVIILNSLETGRAEVIMEGATISAKRTAASAALAARVLTRNADLNRICLVGCGLINFEILRFLKVIFPALEEVSLYDLDESRAMYFRDKLRITGKGLDVKIAANLSEAMETFELISFATTAVQPHIDDVNSVRPDSVILNISLRDFTSRFVLSSVNIVDDVEHICKAQTSVHLAEQAVGNRDFISGTLADFISNRAAVAALPAKPLVFSPFGLGILDIALSAYALELANKSEVGLSIPEFFPVPY